jgi:hypothetical protein
MASRHLSLRIDTAVLDRLDAESRRAGQTRSELAKTFIEEGLRMDSHPGIVFRPSAIGRRHAALADGPKVWVVARVYRDLKGEDADRLSLTAELTELTRYQVKTAVRYYLEYKDEIDNWLVVLDEEADRAFAEWQREQELLSS